MSRSCSREEFNAIDKVVDSICVCLQCFFLTCSQNFLSFDCLSAETNRSHVLVNWQCVRSKELCEPTTSDSARFLNLPKACLGMNEALRVVGAELIGATNVDNS